MQKQYINVLYVLLNVLKVNNKYTRTIVVHDVLVNLFANLFPSYVLELFNHYWTGGKKHENVHLIQKFIQNNYQQMENKRNQKKIKLNIDCTTQIKWSSCSIKKKLKSSSLVWLYKRIVLCLFCLFEIVHQCFISSKKFPLNLYMHSNQTSLARTGITSQSNRHIFKLLTMFDMQHWNAVFFALLEW